MYLNLFNSKEKYFPHFLIRHKPRRVCEHENWTENWKFISLCCTSICIAHILKLLSLTFQIWDASSGESVSLHSTNMKYLCKKWFRRVVSKKRIYAVFCERRKNWTHRLLWRSVIESNLDNNAGQVRSVWCEKSNLLYDHCNLYQSL